MAQTSEEKKATIQALLEERRGYEQRVQAAEAADDSEAAEGAKTRVKGVDAELKRLGASAEKPSERATTRPAQRQASER